MGVGQGRPVGATQQGRQSYIQPAPQGFSPVGFAGMAGPQTVQTPFGGTPNTAATPTPTGFFGANGLYNGMGPSHPMGTPDNWTPPVGNPNTAATPMAQVQPPYVQPAPQGFSPVGFAGARGVATPMPSATPMAPRVPPGLPGTFTPQPSNPMAQPQQVRPEDQRMQAMRFLQQFKGFR